jgi:hypothetical protein
MAATFSNNASSSGARPSSSSAAAGLFLAAAAGAVAAAVPAAPEGVAAALLPPAWPAVLVGAGCVPCLGAGGRPLGVPVCMCNSPREMISNSFFHSRERLLSDCPHTRTLITTRTREALPGQGAGPSAAGHGKRTRTRAGARGCLCLRRAPSRCLSDQQLQLSTRTQTPIRSTLLSLVDRRKERERDSYRVITVR